ncbi:MAG: Bug family tripartite tricarboxylate transporter substrate binding protein [Hyphomicrobiaceae bacterium]
MTALAAVLALLPTLAMAQKAFPERHVTAIVGFPAGGGTDLIVRGMQRAYETALGTQLIVKNVPGAAATIAATEASEAAPDGYTLLAISNALIIQPHRMKLKYDAKAFEPVCLLADTPLVLITTKTSKIKTMADLIAAAKAEPGKLPYASPGAGSALHLGMAALDHRLQLKMKHVPFKGTSEMIQAMLAGTLDVTTGQPTTVQQYEMVALASLSAKRLLGFESVPTVKEATGTEVISSIWTGIFAPPKTPKAIIDVLDKACKTALADKETVAHFEKQSQPVTYLDAAAFRKFVDEDYERTRVVMEAAGLKTN